MNKGYPKKNHKRFSAFLVFFFWMGPPQPDPASCAGRSLVGSLWCQNGMYRLVQTSLERDVTARKLSFVAQTNGEDRKMSKMAAPGALKGAFQPGNSDSCVLSTMYPSIYIHICKGLSLSL